MSDSVETAHRDLADFERRIVLMEADRHRAREIAELFEQSGCVAEAIASYRLAGEPELASVLAARFSDASPRRRTSAPKPIALPEEGPYTLLEELTLSVQANGGRGLADQFAQTFARALAGRGLPPVSVVQFGAKIEAIYGPLPDVRVEIASALLCLGEDASAYQILLREVARPEASLRARKLLAGVLEARGRDVEALALMESVAAVDVDYPGVRAALLRLSSGETGSRRRYEALAELRSSNPQTRVSLARDRRLARDVVVKRWQPLSADNRARLERELQVRDQASHPALVRILDVDPKSCALIYERLEGDLTQLPGDGGAQPHEWARVGNALARMHDAGFAHNRVTAEHILYSKLRGLVLAGLGETSETLSDAPNDVLALAQCVFRFSAGHLSEAHKALLLKAQSPELSQRPTARALARSLGSG